jgi:hypothetical protein
MFFEDAKMEAVPNKFLNNEFFLIFAFIGIKFSEGFSVAVDRLVWGFFPQWI